MVVNLTKWIFLFVHRRALHQHAVLQPGVERLPPRQSFLIKPLIEVIRLQAVENDAGQGYCGVSQFRWAATEIELCGAAMSDLGGYVDLEVRVGRNHPLRSVRAIVKRGFVGIGRRVFWVVFAD
jgi:hypothetical protein